MRQRQADINKAKSMASAAAKDMRFILSLKPSEDAGSTIVRGVYENFRLLGDALLISQGIEAEDHIETIDALMRLKVSASRPLGVLDNLRRLRHSVNYRGYRPSVTEIEDTISVARALFEPLKKKVLKQLEGSS